jgi:hypothetical protein
MDGATNRERTSHPKEQIANRSQEREVVTITPYTEGADCCQDNPWRMGILQWMVGQLNLGRGAGFTRK